MSGQIQQAPATAEAALAELRQLVAHLDRSAAVRQDPDARRLIDQSRLLLAAGAPPRPASARGLGRRPDGLRRLGKKFGRVGLALLGLLPFAFAAGAAAAFLEGAPNRAMVLAGLAALLALGQRASRLLDWGYEVGFRIAYGAAIGRDWFAEAFFEAAEMRLAAKDRAFAVMADWRRWSGTQPDPPTLESLPRFFATRYGPAAAEAFRAALAAAFGAGAGRKRATRRLARLRWSALMPLFERVAASGVLAGAPSGAGSGSALPSMLPGAPSAPRPPVAAVPGPETVAEPPELIARRQSLVDAIRRKREEINTVHNWRMSKPEELAQRDRHLADLRQELAGLEASLVAIGGIVPKPGVVPRSAIRR